jgi:hypothetical protein
VKSVLLGSFRRQRSADKDDLLPEAPCTKASLPSDEAKALTAVEQAPEGINTVGPSEGFPRAGLLVDSVRVQRKRSL